MVKTVMQRSNPGLSTVKIVHNHLRKINRMTGPQSTTNSSQ